jgi:hypothetical protein
LIAQFFLDPSLIVFALACFLRVYRGCRRPHDVRHQLWQWRILFIVLLGAWRSVSAAARSIQCDRCRQRDRRRSRRAGSLPHDGSAVTAATATTATTKSVPATAAATAASASAGWNARVSEGSWSLWQQRQCQWQCQRQQRGAGTRQPLVAAEPVPTIIPRRVCLSVSVPFKEV